MSLIRASLASAHISHALLQLKMDSFDISALVIVNTPTNEDTGNGNSGNSYCVVTQSEPIPTNEEDGNGNSGNSYCVVA